MNEPKPGLPSQTQNAMKEKKVVSTSTIVNCLFYEKERGCFHFVVHKIIWDFNIGNSLASKATLEELSIKW